MFLISTVADKYPDLRALPFCRREALFDVTEVQRANFCRQLQFVQNEGWAAEFARIGQTIRQVLHSPASNKSPCRYCTTLCLYSQWKRVDSRTEMSILVQARERKRERDHGFRRCLQESRAAQHPREAARRDVGILCTVSFYALCPAAVIGARRPYSSQCKEVCCSEDDDTFIGKGDHE